MKVSNEQIFMSIDETNLDRKDFRRRLVFIDYPCNYVSRLSFPSVHEKEDLGAFNFFSSRKFT